MIVVLVTCPQDSGEKIAQVLLEKKLCACVNIVGKLNSLFWWQGKIETEKESLLIIKTKASLFSQLEKEVRSLHPYDVPEIISFVPEKISKPYLSWLDAELNSGDNP